MWSTPILTSIITLIPFVHGVAFGGPEPTGTAHNVARAVQASMPETTKAPMVAEWRRRGILDSNTCGWVDGDYSSGITCSLGLTCMLYTASNAGMVGCCDSTDRQDCGWSNSCVDYDAFTSGSCGSDCLRNSFVRKCTNPVSPYCATWTYPSDGVADYGCVSYNAGIETVLQELSDIVYTGSVSLSKIGGKAVTGWDGDDVTSDLSTSTETDSAQSTSSSSSGGSFSSSGGKKKSKKFNTTLIVGAAAGGFVLLLLVIAILIFVCIKKKRSRRQAANQVAIAAAQSSRPQSSYSHQPKPHMQQPDVHLPPPVPQSYNGYFASPAQQDAKINPQAQVHDYGLQSPVSNPPTPAPAYMQPYYAPPNAPPTPTQSPAMYPTREPTPGTYEMGAISAPRRPAGQGYSDPVYEIGSGK